jgi:hypothetical protein
VRNIFRPDKRLAGLKQIMIAMGAIKTVHLQVKWLLLESDLKQDRNVSRNLVHYIKITFHECLLSGSIIVAYRDGYRQRGKAELQDKISNFLLSASEGRAKNKPFH